MVARAIVANRPKLRVAELRHRARASNRRCSARTIETMTAACVRP
jgi:hypothetical protein